MGTHLEIIGIITIVLGIGHILLPRYLNWKYESAFLSRLAQNVIQINTFLIALVHLLVGLLCLTSANELMQTDLGHKLSGGLFIFWSVRLVCQIMMYPYRPWSGKHLETTIHVLLSVTWFYFALVFLLIVIYAYLAAGAGPTTSAGDLSIDTRAQP